MTTQSLISQMDTWFDHLIGQAVFYEILAIAIGSIILTFIAHVIVNKARHFFQDSNRLWEAAFFSAVHKPLVYLILLLGILFIVDIVQYRFEKMNFLAMTELVRYTVIILLMTWFSWRFINVVQKKYLQRIEANTTKAERTTITSLAKLTKTFVLFFAIIMVIQTFGVKVSGILAFGGIGTAAVAFSSKDLLANFFGGLIVYLDKPFKEGDWVRSPDRQIEGVVEQIGWRLTKIRTFDKRPLYVPNSVFNTIAIENPSRMSNRRIYHKIGLRYQDASKIQVILQDIEAMLRGHRDIDTRQLLIVKLVEFASSSLTFMVYTFTKTTKWVEFQAVQQDILLNIIDIVLKHEAEFAFPSTTLYIPDDIKASVSQL